MDRMFSIPCKKTQVKYLKAAGLYSPEDVRNATEKPARIGVGPWAIIQGACSNASQNADDGVEKYVYGIIKEHTWYNQTVHIKRKGRMVAGMVKELIVQPGCISMVVVYVARGQKMCSKKTPSNIMCSHEKWRATALPGGNLDDISDSTGDDEDRDPDDPIYAYSVEDPALPKLVTTCSRSLLHEPDWERVDWVFNDVNDLLAKPADFS